MLDKNSSPKRFNLKLPPLIRPMFEEPFDAYLLYLLNLTASLTSFDALTNACYETSYNLTPVTTSRWTLWISREIRTLFDDRKSILAPTKSHGGFVEILISYRNQLKKRGELPYFGSQSLSSITLDGDSIEPRGLTIETRKKRRYTYKKDLTAIDPFVAYPRSPFTFEDSPLSSPYMSIPFPFSNPLSSPLVNLLHDAPLESNSPSINFDNMSFYEPLTDPLAMDANYLFNDFINGVYQ